MDKLLSTDRTTPRSPQLRCDDCGVGGTPIRVGRARACCPGCGTQFRHLMRDGIPLNVWLSLADNEDAQGRVPRDRDWTPS